MSLTSWSRWRPEISTLPTYERCLSVSVPKISCSSSSENPMTAFSGVRSSWLMLARNELLAWLAASASSLALISSRCTRSRSVTSELQLLVGLAQLAGALLDVRLELGVRQPQPQLDALAVHELADLPGERAHHRQLLLVGRAHVAAEERDDADDVGPVAQRRRERATQAGERAQHRRRRRRRRQQRLRRHRRQRRVPLGAEIGHPDRQVAIPDLARQVLLGAQLDAPPHRQVRRRRRFRRVPDLDAAEELLALVDLPQLAEVPAVALRPRCAASRAPPRAASPTSPAAASGCTAATAAPRCAGVPRPRAPAPPGGSRCPPCAARCASGPACSCRSRRSATRPRR